YIFFGYYPLIKWRIDRLPGKGIRVLLKLLVFSLSLTLMYLFLTYVLRVTAVIADFQEMGRIMTVLFFLAMLVCLMLYDRLLTPLTIIYVTRWQPKLRKLMKR
ncbi:MAG: hypothetical protein IJ229_13375, partial [Clostridia bacterium]|nr:hypothetical protein [Clostridia bacterium]